MMKQQSITKNLLILFMSMIGICSLAHDIEVQNADGVTIFYNYINDGTELEVTHSTYLYEGFVVIPEEVTYMNRTRKVTRIGNEAFHGQIYLTSVTIPNSVTIIGSEAFSACNSLTSATIPSSVTSIGSYAFSGCSSLPSITIPNSVTSIGIGTFANCISLTSATIPNSVTSIGEYVFQGCIGLTSVTIPNNVTSIGNGSFSDCSSLTSVTIPNNVTSIGGSAFAYCSSLTSVTIPNSVTSIGDYAFSGCSSLTSVTIGNGVTSIENHAFSGCDIIEVISKIENPFVILTNTFSDNTFYNATLYVPVGAIGKYKATEGWKKFLFIKEGNGSGGDTPTTQKCEEPTISYINGKLKFNCATNGISFQSTISDTDINSYNSNEIQLGVTYKISVYATKAGYEDSETVTATLCWIDVDPKTEGITNSVANIHANAVLIQSQGGILTIEGIGNSTSVKVYNVNGILVGSTISNGGSAMVKTNLPIGSPAIVKIGDKNIKIVVK